MKILKEGKKKDFNGEKFVCEKCGCEFVCGHDEFWTDHSITSTTCPAQYNIYASCPNYYKVCHSYITEHASATYSVVLGTESNIHPI